MHFRLFILPRTMRHVISLSPVRQVLSLSLPPLYGPFLLPCQGCGLPCLGSLLYVLQLQMSGTADQSKKCKKCTNCRVKILKIIYLHVYYWFCEHDYDNPVNVTKKYQGAYTCTTLAYRQEYRHRVDNVIESSLREIIGRKNFALIKLNLNFCETTIYDNKVFLENLVAVH